MKQERRERQEARKQKQNERLQTIREQFDLYLTEKSASGEITDPGVISLIKRRQQILLERFADHMSERDFEFTMTFLKLKRFTAFNPRLEEMREPETWFWNGQLQTRHLGWKGFSTLMSVDHNDVVFRSDADLGFLRHFADTAERRARGRKMVEKFFRPVFEEAVRSWEARQLVRLEPELSAEIAALSALPKKSRNQRVRSAIDLFANHILEREPVHWGSGPRNIHKTLLNDPRFLPRIAEVAISYPSDLNALIFEKYADLFRRTQIPYEVLQENWVDFDQDYSHPRVFERSSFERGNLASLAKFLADNRYETAMRVHLLRILDRSLKQLDLRDEELRMNGLDPAARENHLLFNQVFSDARLPLDQKVQGENPAPARFALNLNIFSVKSLSLRDPKAGVRILDDPYLVETEISWCPIRRRPYASYVSHRRLNDPGQRGKTASAFKRLANHIRTFFKDIYGSDKSLSEADRRKMERSELSAPIVRMTYFVFTDRATGKMKAMFRLFDGSSLYDSAPAWLGQVPKPKLFFEKKLKNLVLEERLNNGSPLELGRLGATHDVTGAVLPLLARVAEYLNNSGKRGHVYMEALEGAARLYSNRYGATLRYSPKDLGIGPEGEQIHILRDSVEDFIDIYGPDGAAAGDKTPEETYSPPLYRKGFEPPWRTDPDLPDGL